MRTHGMTAHVLRQVAAAVLRLTPHGNDALAGDLEEQLHSGRSAVWYWLQVAAIIVRVRRVQVALGIAALMTITATIGWWVGTRFAVPLVLGFTLTSWKLWRLHRTSLVLLYAMSVALVFPRWMMDTTVVMNGGDRLFWAIARVLAGYGIVGLLLVPFLILRLARSGPLAEQPVTLSLGR
jgi:hypothetical protein